MSIRRMAFAGLVAAAATLAVTIGVALPASAGTVDEQTEYAAVQGHIEVIRDTTTWDFVVSKRSASTCVYAKVTVDVVNFPSYDHVSTKICPSDPVRHVDFAGKGAHPFTRAARVSLCKQVPFRPDHCEQVWYERGR